MLVLEVSQAFQKEKIPFAIVGGMALALHGIVRSTMDVDVVIHLTASNLEKAESALIAMGLQSRIPVRAKDIAAFRLEYINKRNLIAWSFVDPRTPTRQIDLLIHIDLKDVEFTKIKVGGHSFPVASLQALKEMKLQAGRPIDQIDIQRIDEKIKKG